MTCFCFSPSLLLVLWRCVVTCGGRASNCYAHANVAQAFWVISWHPPLSTSSKLKTWTGCWTVALIGTCCFYHPVNFQAILTRGIFITIHPRIDVLFWAFNSWWKVVRAKWRVFCNLQTYRILCVWSAFKNYCNKTIRGLRTRPMETVVFVIDFLNWRTACA